ncbi:MAG: glycerophosphodiester phosphodiesterase [Bacteroidetes bacterium]|jgi:glycerophosphoryl diester phosphodiesterase|nr:glycerophosphodiester phosphodiesterase [Bacteroidota bacterium]
MLRYIIIAFWIFYPITFIAQSQPLSRTTEIHGHRGFRGHYPENTLTAFKEAARLGVNAIEMDIIISKDSQVVVSHEAWFNYKFCSEPTGEKVKALKQHNLFKMNYDEIKTFDCGLRKNSEFPDQQTSPEYKPLLSETIETLEQFWKENDLPPITYNIEIKGGKIGDGKWHPEPAKIAELVLKVVNSFDINERILIQSFDIRSLQTLHKLNPDLKLGLLIANTGSVDHNIRKLGFTPYMYNPALKLTKEHTVKQAHHHGCKIMPWTINKEEDMKRLIDWGVDGIITDYPNIALKLRKS